MIECTCYHYPLDDLMGEGHKDCCLVNAPKKVLDLNTILKRLIDNAEESRKLGYVHMGLLIPVLDLFLQGHIDRLYLEETINELTVFKSSPDEGNVE
jgi:hypothetical protein